MYAIQKYTNFIIKPHRPRIVDNIYFDYLLKTPHINNILYNYDEINNLSECGIYLNNFINIQDRYITNNAKYNKNLLDLSNKVLAKSTQIVIPHKKPNYKLAIYQSIRLYDIIYGIQLRTIFNYIEEPIQVQVDTVIENSLYNMDIQLNQLDLLIKPNIK